MNEGKERQLSYLDSSLDPRIEASIREIAAIQSKLTALEVINADIKPELKALREPRWGEATIWVGAFLTFMIFYAALERSMQASDARANQVGVEHNDQHLKDLEQKVKELREYIDARDDAMRQRTFTRAEHELFDKDRFQKLQEVENRIIWLEHQCGKK